MLVECMNEIRSLERESSWFGDQLPVLAVRDMKIEGIKSDSVDWEK